MNVIPHIPYSPNLAPCEFSLFLNPKLVLKVKRFGNIIMIQEQLHAVLGELQNNNSAIASNNGIIAGHTALCHNSDYEQDSIFKK
jgi:hypothetical protein